MMRVGQAVGVVSGVICLGLTAVFLFAHPYGQAGMTSASEWGMVGLAVLAGGTAVLAYLNRPQWILLTFILSFVPVGFYLLLTPGIFRWVGVAHLGYLAAYFVLTAVQKRNTTSM